MKIADVANPPPLETHAAVYDSLGDRLIIYNPYTFVDGAAVASSQMWEFRLSLPDSGWRRLSTIGPAPLGIRQSSMVIDALNYRILWFGGYSINGAPANNDLYQLSLAGTPAWSVVPAIKDTLRARFDAYLCIDESSRTLVLYGGTAAFSDHFDAVDDVWTLPLDAPPVWTLMPSTSPPPPKRFDAQLAWDPRRRQILVHGGVNASSTGVLGDTWALSLGDTARWAAIAQSGPQVPRAYGGAIVDPASDRLILGPGGTRTYPPPTSEREAYQLPLAPGGEWSPAPAPDAFDGSSYTYAAVRDARRERMIALGNTFVQAFSLTDTTGWKRLWPPDPVHAPGVVTGHVLVSDVTRHVVWSVGGSEQGGFNDLWKLRVDGSAQWEWLPQPYALPQSGHTAAFDGGADRMLAITLLDNPKIFEVAATGTPSEIVSTPRDTFPSTRVDYTTVIDPLRQRLIVFGGQYFAAHFSGTSRADLWTVPLDDLTAWTPLLVAGPAPGARGEHFAFYDDQRDRMVVFGGWQQTGGPLRQYFHDAWALSLSGAPAWTALEGFAWDPPVAGRLTYDPTNHRLFLFHSAELGSPGATTVSMRGIEDSDAWAELETIGSPPLKDAPVAFAPWADRLVVMSTNSDGTQSDETWALQIDHVVAALASLERLHATSETVSLAWRLGESNGGPVALTRREGDGPMRTLAQLTPDGEGRVAYDDRQVTAGSHMVYRLLEGTRLLIETSVTVPGNSVLSFAGTRPAPARGVVQLAFALPVASDVRLEFYDIRGTRVLMRELGRQDPGEHLFTLRETASLRPGLYLARMITGAGTREAKVVLLH
ncbi:MAG: hypothetical protein ABIR01_10440 [Candidatus Eisenbacteria bacterium]